MNFSFITYRFDGKHALQLVDSITVAESWITHLAVSSWILTETGKCKYSWIGSLQISEEALFSGEACLAYGVADGSVGLVKITESLQPLSSIYSFGPEYSLDTVFEAQDRKPSTPDQRGITALSWVEILGAVVSGPIYAWEPFTMPELSFHSSVYLSTANQE